MFMLTQHDVFGDTKKCAKFRVAARLKLLACVSHKSCGAEGGEWLSVIVQGGWSQGKTKGQALPGTNPWKKRDLHVIPAVQPVSQHLFPCH